jgi:GNAT superfamily N-acetyltransferase
MGAPETGRFFFFMVHGSIFFVIHLRAADRFDALALAALRAAALVELELVSAAHADVFAARATHEFAALFRDDRLAAWMAYDGDRAVGSCCAVFYDRLPYPDGSRHAELCGVYVLPAYRNRGFASELVREVVATAQAGGARKTFLRPSKTAKRLYARLGFVETDLMAYDHRPVHEMASGPALAVSPSR